MRLTLLGSGSSGNCAFLEAGPTRLLVDAGLPKPELEKRLARVPARLKELAAVLVTHDHNDHAGCAAQLGRPIYATAGTRQACGWPADEVTRVLAGQPFTVGDFAVTPVLLPHDAVETVGYVLAAEGARVGILTDCGHDAPDVAAAFAGCDVMVLEANYDVTLLKHGPYPPSLKRRVGGRLGHLSNDQAAALLRAMCLAAPAPKLVIAAHVSQANNRPLLAKRSFDRVLGRGGRVIVAHAERGAPTISIVRGRVTVEADINEQLSFDFSTPRAAEELHE